jgi:hypothetical protein
LRAVLAQICTKRHAWRTWRRQPLDRPIQNLLCGKRVQCETDEQTVFANNLIEKQANNVRFEALVFSAAAKLHAKHLLCYSTTK